jgi:hypothetical protein
MDISAGTSRYSSTHHCMCVIIHDNARIAHVSAFSLETKKLNRTSISVVSKDDISKHATLPEAV